VSIDLAIVAKSLAALGSPGDQPAGAVVGVRVNGEVAVAVSGWAVLPEEHSPGRSMTVDTVLDLASVTKIASTTALAMQLAGDGRLDLDEPVRDDGVTVRDLLAHTSGMPPWSPLYCATTERGEALELASATALVAEPGTAWSYSDLGMITLGGVLESVTGQRQDDLFARLVARPLGLGTAAYGPVDPASAAASSDGDAIEREMVRAGEPYPTPFTVGDFDGWRSEPTIGIVNDGNAAHALGGVAGHAGLFASVPDLLRLGAWLTDRAVHGDVLDEFARPLDIASDRALGFRLATWRVGGADVPMVLHPGFTGTVLASALDRELVVAAAATRLHGTKTPVPVADVVRVALDGVAAAIEEGQG
jgi:CubicO group peptidase (beta-lactamase class C family)